MEWALILVLFACCVGMLGAGLCQCGGVYQFPFLAGATFLGFVVPQLPALAADRHLPDGAVAKTVGFTILCVLCCWQGWAAGRRPVAMLNWQLDRRRVVLLSAFLSVCGSVLYYKMSTLPKEYEDVTLYSGLPVAYLFFAKLLPYGLYLAVLCVARWRSRAALVIAAMCAALLLHRMVILGRRSDIAEFLLVVAMSAWFCRGIAVPRAMAIVGVMLAALTLNSTGNYRVAAGAKDGPDWSKVAEIDIVDDFSKVLRDGGLEMRNAVLRIHDADRLMAFDFGLYHWNVFVYNFVPAQVVGAQLKQSMLVVVPLQSDRAYIPATGTTETGMADAFASFWYLGCLKFYLIAYALGRLYRTALQGAFAAQIAYMVSIVPAMLAITHHTQWPLSSWVHAAIFLLPGFLMTRQSGKAVAVRDAHQLLSYETRSGL